MNVHVDVQSASETLKKQVNNLIIRNIFECSNHKV